MSGGKKNGQSSINAAFFRAMSRSAIVFILLLLLVTSLIFFDRILDIERESSRSHLSYVADQLTYYMKTVDNYSKTIMVDAAIQSYMLRYNNDRPDLNALDEMNIKRKISHIIQSTDFIHSVTLYSPERTRIITTEIYPYAGSLDEDHDFAEAVWQPGYKYSNTNRSVVLYAHSLVRPFYDYITGTLLGYMEIAVPESTISDIYRGKSSRAGSLFIVDSAGTIESSAAAPVVGSEYDSFEQVIRARTDNSSFHDGYIVFSRYFPQLDWYIISEVNLFELLRPTFAAFGLALILAVMAIVASLLVSHRLAGSITRPVYRLINHTQRVKAGDWQPLYESAGYSDIETLFTEFNDMIVAQDKLKNELVDSEKQKNRISLELLQQQINPHFLYNTLDNIAAVAELGEKETLIDLVMNLSTFYRQGLSDGSLHVTVRKELEITRAYLQIMSVRYYDRFDYEINCPPELENYTCIKFLLQPIVENSIYHGIKEISGRGRIIINVNETTDSITFTVLDNGVGLDEGAMARLRDSNSDHFGVKNIHRRIQLYYGNQYGLNLSNRPDGGCAAVITIGKKEIV